MVGLTEYFFYSGNQTSSEIASELKRKFIRFVKGPYVPPFYCLRDGVNICRPEKLQVFTRKRK